MCAKGRMLPVCAQGLAPERRRADAGMSGNTSSGLPAAGRRVGRRRSHEPGSAWTSPCAKRVAVER